MKFALKSIVISYVMSSNSAWWSLSLSDSKAPAELFRVSSKPGRKVFEFVEAQSGTESKNEDKSPMIR